MKGDLIMNMRKISRSEINSKGVDLSEFDHCVAIDWSIRTMAIAHMGAHSSRIRVFERKTDLDALKEYLCSLRGRTVVVIEETTSSHWLFVELSEIVERMVICDPFRNKLLSDGAKTDKIDATKLCQLARAGLLKEVYHHAGEVYQLRRFVSAYEDLVKAGVRLKNQRNAFFQSHSSAVGEAPFILHHLEAGITSYEKAKAEYEKRFKELCHGYRPARLLLDVTGIAEISALTITAIVVDAHRFPRSSHYLIYCGLMHFRKESGGRDYGKRKPRFNHVLKRIYKLAAMSAISHSHNPMRDYYDALRGQGVAEHNARHAVARYIARVTYGILKSGTQYRPYSQGDRHQAA
jgi:transposase